MFGKILFIRFFVKKTPKRNYSLPTRDVILFCFINIHMLYLYLVLEVLEAKIMFSKIFGLCFLHISILHKVRK